MAKDKELIQAEKASEASDKELENVSGGTEITDNESININNNIFDTSIKFDNSVCRKSHPKGWLFYV